MRWSVLPAALCLLASSAAAAGQHRPDAYIVAQAVPAEEVDTPRDGMPVSDDTAKKVRAFIEHFIDADKTPQEQAALFTERAEYYEHGYVDREHIVRDVERYMKHWPRRHYEIAGIDYMSADPESDRIFVAYTIDFEVARGERSARGKASYGAIIKDIAGEPKVESIKEKVNARSSGSNE